MLDDTSAAAGHPTDYTDAATIRRYAARAHMAMDAAGVPPTPRHFALWYTHVSGANPALSQQITALGQGVVSPAELAALHADFPYPASQAGHIGDQAAALETAAQSLVDDVASNTEHIRRYGDVLSAWSERLGIDHQAGCAVDSLVQAVSVLAVETARAAERNRTLEQMLTASSMRIMKLKDSLADVKRGASIDALTGLCNRGAFDNRLRRAIGVARNGTSPVSVLLLDIDHFKSVNDSYGHQTGDLVLRLIGRLLSESVKGRDTAARYGGEEFAVLLMGAGLEAAAVVGDQIRSALEGKRLISRRWGDQSGTVTVSIGVAQFQPGDTSGTLLKRADVALYRAKAEGRNRVCVG